jgi:hypothetical protein
MSSTSISRSVIPASGASLTVTVDPYSLTTIRLH